MADDATKQGKQPDEGAPDIDLSKYVGKEDYEKALSERDEKLEKLEGELEKAKTSLLDPEYIEYLESKKDSKDEDAGEKNAQDKDLPLKGELTTLRKELNMTKAKLYDVLAVMELESARKRYSDFDDYKEEIKETIESSEAPLTYDQAYHIAKSAKGPKNKDNADNASGDAKSKANKTPETEKPSGSVPGDSLKQKDYKSAQEAANAAWDDTVGDKETL